MAKKQPVQHFPLQYYLRQLLELFGQAQRSHNPALFLHRHNARTLLFMVESLLRLLSRAGHQAATEKALKMVKKLEDSLGRIGDYEDLVKHFSKIKSVEEKQLDYFSTRRDKELYKLNNKLLQKEFYLGIFETYETEFTVNFAEPALVAQLREEMRQELETACDFFKVYHKGFDDLDSEVHELRRKLRWLSIYAQSLQGLIVLEPEDKKHAWEKEFITRRELQSPYSKVPVRSNLPQYLAFHKNAFYALSFVINQLGEIKDRGFLLESFKKMLKKTAHARHPARKAIEQLKLNYSMPDVFEEARALLDKFFVRYALHKKLL